MLWLERYRINTASLFHAYLDDPSSLLWDYNGKVSFIKQLKAKLKNPINSRTGQPLRASTIYQHTMELRRDQRELKELKVVIRIMLDHGVLGNKKPEVHSNIFPVAAFHERRKQQEEDMAERRMFEKSWGRNPSD